MIVKGGIKEFVYKFWVISSQEKGNWIYVIGHIGHTVQISDCDSLEENFISKLFAEEYPDIGVCLDKKQWEIFLHEELKIPNEETMSGQNISCSTN